MLDLMQRVNWDEYLFFLSQGYPPVSLQLLALNAMLVIFWLFRRARKRKSRQTSAWLLPVLFCAGNVGVIAWGSQLSF